MQKKSLDFIVNTVFYLSGDLEESGLVFSDFKTHNKNKIFYRFSDNKTRPIESYSYLKYDKDWTNEKDSIISIQSADNFPYELIDVKQNGKSSPEDSFSLAIEVKLPYFDGKNYYVECHMVNVNKAVSYDQTLICKYDKEYRLIKYIFWEGVF